MFRAAARSGSLVIRDAHAPHFDGAYGGLHGLVPVLLGLAAPGLIAAYVLPAYVEETMGEIVLVYLSVMFVAAGVVFVRSVFNPGAVIEVTFDTRSRTAVFVRDGAFGTTRESVPFRLIADVYNTVCYERDGSKTFQPVVLLKSDATVPLPKGTTSAEIERARVLIAS